MVHMNGVLSSSGTLSQGLLPTCLDYCSEFTTVVIPCVYVCGVCMCMHVWVYVVCVWCIHVGVCGVYVGCVCVWYVYMCGVCVCMHVWCICICVYDKI